MAHRETAKSIVRLTCYDKNTSEDRSQISTGFVCARVNDGLFVLATCHQYNQLFNTSETLPLQSIPKDRIGVKICMFDEVTVLDAVVVHYDEVKDLSLLFVQVDPTRLTSEPLCYALALEVTNADLYPTQEAYTIHHPSMHFPNGETVSLVNQQSSGFIVDPNYQSSGIIHFHMPLTMLGSSGAPIIEKNSNKVLGMVKSFHIGYYIPPTHKLDSQTQGTVERWYGISAQTIKQFYQECDAVINNTAAP